MGVTNLDMTCKLATRVSFVVIFFFTGERVVNSHKVV